MRLTANFSLHEFNKHGEIMPDSVTGNIHTLARNLQVLRDEVKRPITITSGYRSPARNAKIGGAKASKHITGEAADIQVQGMTPREVAAVIERLIAEGRMLEGGLGIYRSWVHYDIFFDGRNKRRWTK
jgi:uncharacterized protein YcbK (DUF882 family)